MMFYCWPTVCDVGRTLNKQWVKSGAYWKQGIQYIRGGSIPGSSRHWPNAGLMCDTEPTFVQHRVNVSVVI